MKLSAWMVLSSLLVASVAFAEDPPCDWKCRREKQGSAAGQALSGMADHAHEREMQRRQFAHELEMQRLQQQAAASQSQQVDADVSHGITSGFVNGFAWQALGEDSGAGLYVKGYIDGLIIFGADETRKRWDRCACSPGDVASGVTEFYRENPAYMRMPVIEAVKLFVWKATGTSRDTIDGEAARIMRVVAGLHE